MKYFFRLFFTFMVVAVLPFAVATTLLWNMAGLSFKDMEPQGFSTLSRTVPAAIENSFLRFSRGKDVASAIERNRSISDAEKAQLILKKMASDPSFLGILLLDKNFNVTAGMTADQGTYVLNPDKELLKRTASSEETETGHIALTAEKLPYFDTVYPLISSSGEYLYVRTKLDELCAQVRMVLDENEQTQANVVFIDGKGSAAPVYDYGGNALRQDFLADCKLASAGKQVVRHGVRFTSFPSPRSGWSVVMTGKEGSALTGLVKTAKTAGFLLIGCFIMSFFLAFLFYRPQKAAAVTEQETGDKIIPAAPAKEKQGERNAPPAHEEKAGQERMSSILGKGGVNPLGTTAGEATLVKQMANILGHEIRNPLSAMSGALFLVKRHLASHPDANAVVAKPLGIIENEIKSITKIIDNLLDYSRTRPPVLVEKDLRDVVREIVESLKLPGNIELELSMPESYRVIIDVDEVKQVVRNLVNNAADAMSDKEKGNLKISVFRSLIAGREKDVPAVCLNVSDNGCGIEPEKLKKIFEPFFSTKSKGMGLGLAVVQKIIQERHKGTVEVTSEPGAGTTFSVKFPVAK